MGVIFFLKTAAGGSLPSAAPGSMFPPLVPALNLVLARSAAMRKKEKDEEARSVFMNAPRASGSFGLFEEGRGACEIFHKALATSLAGRYLSPNYRDFLCQPLNTPPTTPR